MNEDNSAYYRSFGGFGLNLETKWVKKMITHSIRDEVLTLNALSPSASFAFMSQQHHNRIRDRQVYVTAEQNAALKARKQQVGLSEKHQLATAIEDYLQIQPTHSHRLLLTNEASTRKLVEVPDSLWAGLNDRKEKFGLKLEEQINIAISLYFAKLNGLDYLTGQPLSSTDTSTDSKQSTKDELRAQLGSLGLRVASDLVSGDGGQNTPDPLLAAARIVLSNAALEQQEEGGTIALLSLSSIPCGPWREALEEAKAFAMPRELAEILGARAGDLLIPTEGQSMVEAGVPDGGRVVMRPLRGRDPQVGEIVLCSIEREGGVWESTIKFWFVTPRGAPLLKDGKLREVKLPKDLIEVHPVARLVGVMGRATFGTAKGLSHEARESRRFRRADDDPLSE